MLSSGSLLELNFVSTVREMGHVLASLPEINEYK